MKKNRNNFFAENSYDFNSYNPNLMSANGPYQMANMNSSFYAGTMPYNNMNNDLESRLAKMERQINRLEHRISKLEQNSAISTEDIESNVNNMYMV